MGRLMMGTTTDNRGVGVILPVYEATQNSEKFKANTLGPAACLQNGKTNKPEQHIHELSGIIILCNLMLQK